MGLSGPLHSLESPAGSYYRHSPCVCVCVGVGERKRVRERAQSSDTEG